MLMDTKLLGPAGGILTAIIIGVAVWWLTHPGSILNPENHIPVVEILDFSIDKDGKANFNVYNSGSDVAKECKVLWWPMGCPYIKVQDSWQKYCGSSDRSSELFGLPYGQSRKFTLNFSYNDTMSLFEWVPTLGGNAIEDKESHIYRYTYPFDSVAKVYCQNCESKEVHRDVYG